MQTQNTTLDDISAVIGFTATVRLAAWYGNGNNLFVPSNVEEGQVLVVLIGRSAAERLTKEFGGTHLAVPRISSYEEDMRRQRVCAMLGKGFSTREVSRHERMSERRVQQICREMELAGLMAPVGPAKSVGKTVGKKPPGKRGRVVSGGKSGPLLLQVKEGA